MINTTYVEAEDKLYNIPTYDFSIYRYKKKVLLTYSVQGLQENIVCMLEATKQCPLLHFYTCLDMHIAILLRITASSHGKAATSKRMAEKSATT